MVANGMKNGRQGKLSAHPFPTIYSLKVPKTPLRSTRAKERGHTELKDIPAGSHREQTGKNRDNFT